MDTLAIGLPELFAAGHGGVRQREMMGTGLAGNWHAPLFGGTQQLHTAGGAEMLAMDPGPGEFGHQDVPGDDHLLAGRGPAAQAQGRAPVAFVHDAIRDQRVILAMIHDRQLEHPGIFTGPAHQLVVLDTVAVIGDGHHAGLIKGTDGGQLLAGDALGDGTGDEDVDQAILAGAFMDEGDRAGIINGRAGVGHADDGSETALRRRPGARQDGFLGRLARFAQMDMQIDQPGADDPAGDVQTFNARRGAGGEIGADGGDLSVQNQHIRPDIKLVGGVDHAAAGKEQRIHGVERNAPWLTRQVRRLISSVTRA